jgi:phage/plasmid-like protein (TIGR03299 family)
MFSGRGMKPWHGLGNIVEGLLTAKEAIEAAHLNWTVSKQPLYWTDTKGKRHEFGTKRLVIRDDIQHVLGEVSSSYELFQNAEAFAFCDALVGEGRAVYDTAGALFGGKNIWICLKLNPEDFDDQMKGENFERLVMLFNTFNGEGGYMCHCMTRPVCHNTVTAAGAEGRRRYTFRHAGRLKEQIEEARSGLGIMTENMRQLEKCLAEIRAIKMQQREVVEFAEEMTEVERYRDAIVHLFRNGLGCEGKNRYDAFNAVTQLTSHHLLVRGSEQVKAERLMDSTFNGRGYTMQRKALHLLVP